MHAKATQNNAPLGAIDDDDQRMTIPSDLQQIANKVMASVIASENVLLNDLEKQLLHSKYIHCSANWTPVSGLLVNKPRKQNKRAVYPDQPQRGYPA